jgi:hypothetical protein
MCVFVVAACVCKGRAAELVACPLGGESAAPLLLDLSAYMLWAGPVMGVHGCVHGSLAAGCMAALLRQCPCSGTSAVMPQSSSCRSIAVEGVSLVACLEGCCQKLGTSSGPLITR